MGKKLYVPVEALTTLPERAEMTPKERADDMVDRYGEAVGFTEAGRLIRRSRDTIRAMIKDGRLDAACEGTRVDVRSIARYICAPAQENYKARMRKQNRYVSERYV